MYTKSTLTKLLFRMCMSPPMQLPFFSFSSKIVALKMCVMKILKGRRNVQILAVPSLFSQCYLFRVHGTFTVHCMQLWQPYCISMHPYHMNLPYHRSLIYLCSITPPCNWPTSKTFIYLTGFTMF